MTEYVGGEELQYRRKLADVVRAIDSSFLYHGNGVSFGVSGPRDSIRQQYGGERIETVPTEEEWYASIEGMEEKLEDGSLDSDADREQQERAIQAFRQAADDVPTADELAARHDLIDDVKVALVGDVETFDDLVDDGIDTFLRYGVEERGMMYGSPSRPAYTDWYDDAVEQLEDDGHPGDQLLTDLANVPHDDEPYTAGDTDSFIATQFERLRERL